MENLFEFLIPLLFAAIYFFGNFFAKKDNADELEAPSQRRERRREEDAEAEERQRRIQEEIRRKIMERRGEAGAPGQAQPRMESRPLAAPSPETIRERRAQAEARRQEREEQRLSEEASRLRRAKTEAEVEPTKKPVEKSEVGGFSWDVSDNVYSEGIGDRLREIEAKQKEAAALRRRMAKQGGKPGVATTLPASSGKRSLLSGSVRESLNDPAAARVAFIYGEVLGKPIGLRKGESNVPGLSQ